MPSLIDIVRNKYLEAIRSVKPPQRWKALVVDKFSQNLLGSVLKQFDVLEANVTVIESITAHRSPQPEYEAMYLLMPTNQNVDRIIRDFSGGKQYAAAHLFFTEALAEPLFQRLTGSPAEPHLRVLKELSVNFLAIEAQTFTIQEPSFFYSMYSPPRSESQFRRARNRLMEDLRFTSKMITNVCITLNEFPYIRYYMPTNHAPLGPLKPHSSTRPPPPPESTGPWRTALARGEAARNYEAAESEFVTKILAFMVHDFLEEHKRVNPEFGKTDMKRERATLIITDRSMDMVAPFLHEFTYQAMTHDLLPITDEMTFTYSTQRKPVESRTVTISDNDKYWTALRHMQMKEAIDKIQDDFNKFATENAAFKESDNSKKVSLNDMKDMLASLPQFQEQRDAFSLHVEMTNTCMGIFSDEDLPKVGNVEQCCATGLTSEGKTPKSLVEDMVLLLDSAKISNMNKVRMIALYIQHRGGVPDEDRRRLYQHAGLSVSEQDAVNAMVHLGVKVSKGPNDKDTKKKLKQRAHDEEEYELSRFKPALRTIIEENASGKLDETIFPYVKESPLRVQAQSLRSPAPQATSLRSAKPSWHKAPAAGTAARDDKQRLIVFVAGGMTYSEIREAYQLSKSLGKDIFIGSTHTITPKRFVDDLKVLEIAGVGSKAIPTGLREAPEKQRSYQEYFDDKYYLPDDAPPPQHQRPNQLSVPKQSTNKVTQPSPTQSFGSIISEGSQDQKKKKRFFRF